MNFRLGIVSLVEFIRSKFSTLVAHVNVDTVSVAVWETTLNEPQMHPLLMRPPLLLSHDATSDAGDSRHQLTSADISRHQLTSHGISPDPQISDHIRSQQNAWRCTGIHHWAYHRQRHRIVRQHLTSGAENISSEKAGELVHLNDTVASKEVGCTVLTYFCYTDISSSV